MELTNYSFLQSRNDYMSTIAERKVTADRIATGKRLENAGEDVGAILAAINHRIKGRSAVHYQQKTWFSLRSGEQPEAGT